VKIHSDQLKLEHFRMAARAAGVTIVELIEQGSRSRKRAFKFQLSGSSPYRSQFGNHGGQAATWDEWGMFLNALFLVDPDAHCGKNSYLSADHFHWVTGDRFRTLIPPYQHPRHKWTLGHTFNDDHRQRQSECEYCEAVQRWLVGLQWSMSYDMQ